MGFNAKILCDSVSTVPGQETRLTTMELTLPRVVAAELLTHRVFSRNGASSRAIPTEKLIQRVVDDPFIPDFRMNQKGMQAGEALSDVDARFARKRWLEARDRNVEDARYMHELDCHKQYVNRLLEPWMFITYIVSATDWNNFFHLRVHGDAEPSICKVATMALRAYQDSEPEKLGEFEWHLPLVFAEDIDRLQLEYGGAWDEYAAKVSVGRCARVSYLTHDGKRDLQADIDLHDRLALSGHWSPFEHVATPTEQLGTSEGNFRHWKQYRKGFRDENIWSLDRALEYMEANN